MGANAKAKKPRCKCGHLHHVGMCNKARAGGWGKSRKIVYCGCQEYESVIAYKKRMRML